ncbi:hypothetical protein OIV83_001762 [Microbotryomycetes sp. JL201]|nr:hypothetical protein OIV83_001762 [Microbotryomycetes sp. JL201]
MQAGPVVVDEVIDQARVLVALPDNHEDALAIEGAPSGATDDDNETTPLLANRIPRDPFTTSRSSRDTTSFRPRPAWALFPIFLFTVFNGASMSVLLEILNLASRQPVRYVACRTVDPEHAGTANMTSINGLSLLLPIPAPTYKYFLGLRLAAPPDKEWADQCRQSVAVQKAAATLITQLTMLGGALGGATLAYWGSKSDRLGRVAVLRITVFAQLIGTEAIISLVTFPEYFGAGWCAVGIAIDGLLGGEVATGVLLSAYLADCAPEGSRAQVFSVSEAFYYGGLALGPTLGSWAYSATGLLLLPHYCSFMFFLVWLVCLSTIVPESMSESQRKEERRKAKEQAVEQARLRSTEEQQWKDAGHNIMTMRVLRLLKAPFALLAPLAILLPRPVQPEDDTSLEDQPLLPVTDTKAKKDWRLTLVAIAYGLFMIVPGLMNVKILYTRRAFDWGPVETGYFITFLAVCKLVGLLMIVPLATRMLKWIRSKSVDPTRRTSKDGENTTPQQDRASYIEHLHAAELDLTLAKASIVTMMLAYIVPSVPRPRTSSRFLFGSGVASLAAAASPALQSLAVSLARRRESGQVLASLSVLISLSVQFVGPPLFACIYVAIVERWPEAVFAVAAAWILSSLVPLLCVRLGR